MSEYVRNNRHNNITAYYYYLKQKYEQNFSPRKDIENLIKRSDSSLIYRPNTAMKPQVRFVHEKDYRDCSLNATSIIQTLTYANR